MTTQRTRDGRYTHTTFHAGFDRVGVEWEMCDHCDRFRPLGDTRWRKSAPVLIPNRSWTADELAGASR